MLVYWGFSSVKKLFIVNSRMDVTIKNMTYGSLLHIIYNKISFMFHIHTPILQHGSCIHLAMATKPPPILINSLHPNNAIPITLYINQCIQLWQSVPFQSCTLLLHIHLHNKYSFNKTTLFIFHLVKIDNIYLFINAVSSIIEKCLLKL